MGMSGEKSLPGTGKQPIARVPGGSMRNVLQEQQRVGFAWRGVSKGERAEGEVKEGM